MQRSRKVGQSFFTSFFTTALATLQSTWAVIFDWPDLILTNGPGTCVPVLLAAALCRAADVNLFCTGRGATPRSVFVESACRVTSLSLSGTIIYHCRLADEFVVQWPQLMEGAYPRAVGGQLMF
jgi:beta-1,4-N-acetylglucosaminyltransferase